MMPAIHCHTSSAYVFPLSGTSWCPMHCPTKLSTECFSNYIILPRHLSFLSSDILWASANSYLHHPLSFYAQSFLKVQIQPLHLPWVNLELFLFQWRGMVRTSDVPTIHISSLSYKSEFLGHWGNHLAAFNFTEISFNFPMSRVRKNIIRALIRYDIDKFIGKFIGLL